MNQNPINDDVPIIGSLDSKYGFTRGEVRLMTGAFTVNGVQVFIVQGVHAGTAIEVRSPLVAHPDAGARLVYASIRAALNLVAEDARQAREEEEGRAGGGKIITS